MHPLPPLSPEDQHAFDHRWPAVRAFLHDPVGYRAADRLVSELLPQTDTESPQGAALRAHLWNAAWQEVLAQPTPERCEAWTDLALPLFAFNDPALGAVGSVKAARGMREPCTRPWRPAVHPPRWR